jgi:hypothetical protein
MSTPTIPAGNLFMDATLYTGTGTTQTITNGVAGQSFAPDFVWCKNRGGAYSHSLNDTIRGTSNGLFSNTTGAADTTAGYYVTAFNSNGFSVNLGSETNASAFNYVGWQWKAGGTAVSNTAGTITSQVSANTTSGFSIVTYTGTGSNATVGHGLGVAPSFMIFKQRNNAGTSWQIYHASLGATQALDFTTASAGTTINYWNNTAPTSTVATIGISVGANQNTGTYVAYCWAPIAGYSAFGSYTGNGSATSGAFVYLGFRPRFVIIKRTDSTSSWIMIDSSRDPYNLAGQGLQANSSAAELTPASSGYPIDLLSNGFKLYETGDPNVSSGTYIYACFAENPFKYANAR